MTIETAFYHPDGHLAGIKQLGSDGCMTHTTFNAKKRPLEIARKDTVGRTEVTVFDYDENGNLLRNETHFVN